MRYTHLGTPYDTETAGVVSVLEGDYLWLICEQNANPPATVTWLAGTDIVSQDQELLLSNITRDSAKMYTCIAENTLGQANAELGISVLCRYLITLDSL